MPSSEIPVTISDWLTDEEQEVITERLRAFNLTHAGISWQAPEEARPVHLSARDANGILVGGLVGETHAIPYWLNVSVLWVAEAVRGQGIGTALLRGAEQIARRRSCQHARITTSHYQAPDFYAHHGYREYGRLDDFPPGETVHYFCKRLIS
jgi:GNAT superfamily N-acetyltransferase